MNCDLVIYLIYIISIYKKLSGADANYSVSMSLNTPRTVAALAVVAALLVASAGAGMGLSYYQYRNADDSGTFSETTEKTLAGTGTVLAGAQMSALAGGACAATGPGCVVGVAALAGGAAA